MSGGEVNVGRDVVGQVIVGNHNVVVNARDGTSVSVRADPPPLVPRREPVRPVPLRAGPEPVGRGRELAQITGWLDAKFPVEVCGESGIGKTTLLRRIGAQRGQGRTGAVYLSAMGLSRDELLQEIFQAFYDVEGYRPEPQRLRRLTASVDALVLLDDFSGSPEDLTAVLDAVPSSDIVVAGGQQCLFGDGQTIALGGLDAAAARVLLVRRLGRRLTSEEREQAGTLCSVAGGNPGVLVRTADAVRTVWQSAGTAQDLPLVTLDIAEPALVPRLVERLGGPAHQVLRVLGAFGEVPLPPAPLLALSGGTEAALTELLSAGVLEQAGPGLRPAGSLGHAVAGLAGNPPAPAELTDGLARWASSASPRSVADAVGAITHMLDRSITDTAPAAAVRLARAAAPRLAAALRWDAWAQVLSRGRVAARAAKARQDEAYFEHEDDVRRRVLGTLASAAVAGILAGKAASAVIAHSHTTAPTPPVPSRPPRVGQHLLHATAAHPIVAVAAAVLAAAVTVTAWARVSSTPVDPAVPTATTPTSTSGPATPVSPSASIPTSTVTVPIVPSSPGTPQPTACGRTHAPLDFGAVRVGAHDNGSVTLSPATCQVRGLDLMRMSIEGIGARAYAVTARSCPDVLPPGDSCDITITFSPPEPGTFDARLTVPAAGPDQAGAREVIPLTGTGSHPLSSTTTRTTPTAHGPVIVSTSTYREGVLIYARINYVDEDNDAEGFGFEGANGSGWAPERHPFTSPSYGRVSPGRVDYPFNHACGTPNEYESDVRAFIYDRTGRKSTSVIVHMACP